MFEIRQRLGGLCLIGKIVPEHCTTILKAALQTICVWPWKCYISLDIPKIVIYVSIIEFYKGVTHLGGGGADRSLRILYIKVAFVWKRLVSSVFHFKLFNTPVDLASHQEAVITLPARS